MLAYHGVGIDIGAANSCVAVTQRENTLALENEYGSRQTPTCVAFNGRMRLIGTAAKLQQEHNIDKTLENFTALLGKHAKDKTLSIEQEYITYSIAENEDRKLCIPVSFAGRTWRLCPEQLVAMVLKKLMSMVEASVASTTQAVVIGVPSFYTENERQAVLDAAYIARLENVTLLDMTTAVGIFYAHGPQILPDEGMPSKKVAFINVGHKSTQVSICGFTKAKMEILGSASDPQLGGRDFDRILSNRLQQLFAETYKSGKLTPMLRFRLQKEAELLKIRMTSSASEISVRLERLLRGKDLQCRISRAQFEVLLTDLLTRFKSLLEDCIEASSVKVTEISSVELIGGGFRVQAIQDLIHLVFRQMGHPIVNGDEAVARGCALFAGMISPGVRTYGFSTLHGAQIMQAGEHWDPGYTREAFSEFFRMEDEITELDTQERERQQAKNLLQAYWFELNTHLLSRTQAGNVNAEGYRELIETKQWIEAEEHTTKEYVKRLNRLQAMNQVARYRGKKPQDEITELDTQKRERQQAKSLLQAYWFELNTNLLSGTQAGNVNAEECREILETKQWIEAEEHTTKEYVERLKRLQAMNQVTGYRGKEPQKLFRRLSLFAGSVATLTNPSVPKTHFPGASTFRSSMSLSRPLEEPSTSYPAHEPVSEQVVPSIPHSAPVNAVEHPTTNYTFVGPSTYLRPYGSTSRSTDRRSPSTDHSRPFEEPPTSYPAHEPIPEQVIPSIPHSAPVNEVEHPTTNYTFAGPSTYLRPYGPTSRSTDQLSVKRSPSTDFFNRSVNFVTSKSLSTLPRADEPVLYRTGQVRPSRADRGLSHEQVPTIPQPLPMYQKEDRVAPRAPEVTQPYRPITTSRTSSAHELSLGASAPDLIPSRKALGEYMLRLERHLQARGRFLIDREQWLHLCRSLDEAKSWFKNEEKRKTPDEYEQKLQSLRSMGEKMEKQMKVATEAINDYENTLRNLREVIDSGQDRGRKLNSTQLERLQQLVADHEEWILSVLDPSEGASRSGGNDTSLEYFYAKLNGLKDSYEDILRTPKRKTPSPVLNDAAASYWSTIVDTIYLVAQGEKRHEMTTSLPVVAGTVLNKAGNGPVAYPNGNLRVDDEDDSTNEFSESYKRTVPSESSLLAVDMNDNANLHPTSTDLPGSTTSTLNAESQDSSNRASPISEFFSTPDESFHQAIRGSQRSTRDENSTTKSVTIVRPEPKEESLTNTTTSSHTVVSGDGSSPPLTLAELYDDVAYYEQVVAEQARQLFDIKYEVFAPEAHDTTKLNSRLVQVQEEIRKFIRYSQYTTNLRHVVMDAESDLRRYNKYMVNEVRDTISNVKNIVQPALDVQNKHIKECLDWLEEKAASLTNGYDQIYRFSKEDLEKYHHAVNKEFEILKNHLNVFLSTLRDKDQLHEGSASSRPRYPRTQSIPRLALQDSSPQLHRTKIVRDPKTPPRSHRSSAGESIRLVEY